METKTVRFYVAVSARGNIEVALDNDMAKQLMLEELEEPAVVVHIVVAELPMPHIPEPSVVGGQIDDTAQEK